MFITILFVASFLLVTNYEHSEGYSIIQSGGNYCGGNSGGVVNCFVGPLSTPIVGDTLVVAVIAFNGTGSPSSFPSNTWTDTYEGSGPGGTFVTVTDGLPACSYQNSGSGLCAISIDGEIQMEDVGYIQVSTSAIADSIFLDGIAFTVSTTINPGCSQFTSPPCGFAFIGVMFYEVPALDTSNFIASVTSGSGTSYTQSSNLVTSSPGSFWSAFTVDDAGTGTSVAAKGAGWTNGTQITNSGSPFGGSLQSDALQQSALGFSGSSATTVTGMGTITPSANFMSMLVGFGITSSIATSTISVVKVTACNFYQLECWWEPLIFYGMYVGLWVGIGATMSIRARSMTYLFAAAVSYASVYLILLGELPYPFALMAFIGAFAYGLRLDGVF